MFLLAFIDCPLEVDLVHYKVDRRVVWRQRGLLSLAALQETAVRIPMNEINQLKIFRLRKEKEKKKTKPYW